MGFLTATYFSQNDPRWSQITLGRSIPKDGTIGQKGCTLTTIANLHNAVFKTNFTPLELNTLFLRYNVYAYDQYGYAIVEWVRVHKALPQLNFYYRDRNYSWALDKVIKAWINVFPQMPVIGHVWISKSFPSHFVLMIGGGKIVDALDGKIKPVSTYKEYIGTARFTKV